MSRFKLDGLLAAVGKGVRLADATPIPKIGAGQARAMARRMAGVKAPRYAGFPAFCVRMGLAAPVAEHKFHPERKWRQDFAWPEYRVCMEVEGAVWTNGGHSRGSGKIRDHEKFTAAAVLGWRILYCQPSDLMTAKTIQSIRSAIAFSNNPQSI